MTTLDRVGSTSLTCLSSSGSSISSTESRSPRSCSSSSVHDEQFDLYNGCDTLEGFSDAWLNKESDEDDIGRLFSIHDLDLFPESSLLGLADVTFHELNLMSSTLPGFSTTFRPTSLFEEESSLIPTCVSDFGWEQDSYPDSVFSTENGSSGSEFFSDKVGINHNSISGSSSINSLTLSSSSSIHTGRVTTSTRQINNNNNNDDDDDDKIQRQRRRPGRPRKTTTKARGDDSTSSSSSDNDNNNKSNNDNNDSATHRSRRRRKQHPWKGHHLWEFIRELLENNDDPTRSGGAGEELVRWENREKGVFLIVNSKEVAELWGKRKRNEKMTYEKLSRSLRWCRTSGFLAEVPKDRKYPKKLCFCFGHRAYDIHRTSPVVS